MKKTIIVVLLLIFNLICVHSYAQKNMKKTPKFDCGEKHYIQQGLVGVKFQDNKKIESKLISSKKALEIKKQIETEDNKKWFFESFDKCHLYFFIATYKPNPEKNKRPWGTYIIEKKYKVVNITETTKTLKVDDIVQSFQKGKHGIKAGMNKAKVIKILGEPKETRELQTLGSFDLIYDKTTIRFINFEVVNIL